MWDFLAQSKNEYIICGDLNAKSPAFGCIGHNKNGDFLEEVLLETNTVVLNKHVPTFF
jgi:hypothetical protein